MFIEHLEARGFRNLRGVSLDLDASPVVLVGGNGQGKTNVLEALCLCITGRSFRGAAPTELVAHESDSGRLQARFVRQEVRHDIEVALGRKQRTIHVDGRVLRQALKLLELVNVVSFFPDDLRMVKGGPDERRRFLDRTIANHRPDFVRAAVAYANAVRSRNALLRSPATLNQQLVESYDEQLVGHGTVMQRCREETLAELVPLAVARFLEIMRGHGELGIRFVPGVAPSDDFATTFAAELTQRLRQDRARGMTTVGPHRADLLISINERDARAFASQGQQRAVVLALKLAELEYLRSRLQAPPLLLLDDVSSELDSERAADFLATATRFGSQIWVTTTGAASLPFPCETQRFAVCDGNLTRL